jgi:hypothetical protein
MKPGGQHPDKRRTEGGQTADIVRPATGQTVDNPEFRRRLEQSTMTMKSWRQPKQIKDPEVK